MPALLTKMSMPPYLLTTSSTACETSALTLMLQGKKSQMAPLFAIEAALLRPRQRSISKMATAAPSAASFRAVACPNAHGSAGHDGDFACEINVHLASPCLMRGAVRSLRVST